MLIDMIKEISAICANSGDERAVCNYIISQIDGYAQYSIDPLGNLLVFKKGRERANKKVMLDAHTDEVGMIVTFVGENGLLRFSNVGGIDTKVLLGRTVKIGDEGICGVIGIKPIHLTEEGKERDIPDKDDLYIDIGAANGAEAKAVVCPGDMVYFDSEAVEFGNGFLKGKALDDRIGCALLIEMIKREQPYDLWFTFTVQEEVGMRGAATAAYTLAPDYAIITETTTASDIPEVENEKEVCRLGQGAVVPFMDCSTVYDRALFHRAFALAKEKNIKIQTKTKVAGGNNAGAVHKAGKGVKVLNVSVPTRYLHSPCCVVCKKDVEESAALLQALAEALACD